MKLHFATICMLVSIVLADHDSTAKLNETSTYEISPYDEERNFIDIPDLVNIT